MPSASKELGRYSLLAVLPAVSYCSPLLASRCANLHRTPRMASAADLQPVAHADPPGVNRFSVTGHLVLEPVVTVSVGAEGFPPELDRVIMVVR